MGGAEWRSKWKITTGRLGEADIVLDLITPLILTYNEAPNIERTLSQLKWAREIVVLDSYSTDNTVEVLRQHPRVRMAQRRFDCFAHQWNHGLHGLAITTPWVLALDADYVLSDRLVSELGALTPRSCAGYWASFVYCVHGRPIKGSLYPPVAVLYRREHAHYVQDGHTQRIKIEGKLGRLCSPIYHDDRKSLERWLASQSRYAREEAKLLVAVAKDTLPKNAPPKNAPPKNAPPRNAPLGWADRIRRFGFVAPWLVFAYCLFVKGGVFSGRAGWSYAYQRMVAESLIALALEEERSRSQ